MTDDLSVIGFGNVPESALGDTLTTIEQPIKQMGFDAARSSLPDRRTEPVPDHTLLPTRLVVRGSAALEGGVDVVESVDPLAATRV